mgnify:FL=1
MVDSVRATCFLPKVLLLCGFSAIMLEVHDSGERLLKPLFLYISR